MRGSSSVLNTLIRMRWAAIVGQVTVILVAYSGFSVVLLPAPLSVMLALEALSNLWLFWLMRRSSNQVHPLIVFSVLALDILFLTILLGMTGGVNNPFALLYVVHVTLATVMMARRLAWVLTLIATLCYASLFMVSRLMIQESTRQAQLAEQVMSMQREGMWVAFVITSLFIVYFVTVIREQLARRERELEQMNEMKRRQEHLASLATLSAGAAHELSTPLSTIALIARELELSLGQHSEAQDDSRYWVEDAQLIRAEVMRCQNILQHMASEAGASMGEMLQVMRISTLIREVLDELKWGNDVHYMHGADDDRLCVKVTPRALSFALQGILRNAREAALERSLAVNICIETKRHGDRIALVITDRSGGMDEDVLRRATEPFFSTKETGKGMGLGLFLATTLFERLGGSLDLTSTPEQDGTVVNVVLPLTSPELESETTP